MQNTPNGTQKLSVIIPAFNAERLLAQCLKALSSSSLKPHEIIVSDDASQDGTARVAKDAGCRVIAADINRGPATARNQGAKAATGSILVFIDADVKIRADSLSIIQETFEKTPALSALCGITSPGSSSQGFFTQYKSLYMNFILNQSPEKADFLYGSIMAIQRNHFFPFEERMRMTDDTEIGRRLANQGRRVLLVKRLVVDHLKEYTALTLLLNDFWVPFHWADIFVRQGAFKDMIKKRRFAHAKMEQLASVAVSFLACAALLLSPFVPTLAHLLIFFPLVFALLNRNHFVYLAQKRGAGFLLSCALFTAVDQVAMALGILTGFSRTVLFTR